jgi:cobalt/nickel transport system permease protein
MMSGVIALGLVGQPGAWLRAGNLVLKSTLSLCVLSLAHHRLGLAGMLAGLRWLRLPPLLTQTFAFWGRYSAVLTQEWHRLQLARQARTFTADRGFQFRALTQALGLLFIRAFDRAEKVHRAMLARGYRGDPG